jgi:3-hydroxybutyrate dehydrogenase
MENDLITEPVIKKEDVLVLQDYNFNKTNVCIVTGAGTGIGRATSIAAALNNLTTIGLDINEGEGRKTQQMVSDLGSEMHFIKTDLSKDSDLESAVEQVSYLGNIKYLVNIAGIQHIDSIEKFPMEKYDLMHRIMLRAPLYLSKLTIPYMKKSENGEGVIGNMASIHSHMCTINKAAYNIIKSGLLGLTRSIAAEGEGKVRSFTISTGYVKTPLALKQIPAQAEQRGITIEEVVKDVMMGKSRIKEMMPPIDVANLFMFGFSKHSRYLNGNDLLFDGGCINTY